VFLYVDTEGGNQKSLIVEKGGVGFNATFNNISAISWRSVLLGPHICSKNRTDLFVNSTFLDFALGK
jgi:hypothetical protein